MDTLRVAMTLEQSWHRVPGGTAVAALKTAEAVAHRREVDLVGIAAFHKRRPPEPWTPPVEVFPLPLPRFALYESWHLLRMPRVQRACGRVNVIHATTLAIPPRSAPLVVTVHDLAFLRYPTHFTARGLRLFHRGLELARRDADLVMCSSKATLEDCIANGFPESKLRHVPLGVDLLDADEGEVARVRDRFGLEEPYVMWTGTIEPRKNLPRLLQAFSGLQIDHSLVLVGPEGWNEDLDALSAPLKDRVVRLGFVAPEDLGPLYAGAEVFCFPSLMEGFGFPVLEAMSQGTPVVTSRGTSTEELAGDAGVLVDPLDVASIGEGIDRVLSDRALAETLAAKGREQAARFTWDETARRVVQIYREAAG